MRHRSLFINQAHRNVTSFAAKRVRMFCHLLFRESSEWFSTLPWYITRHYQIKECLSLNGNKETTEHHIRGLNTHFQFTCLTTQSMSSGQSGSGTIRLCLLSGISLRLTLLSPSLLLLLVLLFFLGERDSRGLRVTRILGSCTTSRFCPDTRIILPPLDTQREESFITWILLFFLNMTIHCEWHCDTHLRKLFEGAAMVMLGSEV